MAWCEIYVFGCGYECSMVMGKCLAVSMTNCGCFRVVERCLRVFYVGNVFFFNVLDVKIKHLILSVL